MIAALIAILQSITVALQGIVTNVPLAKNALTDLDTFLKS